MDVGLFAKALGTGMERAALLTYSQACEMLDRREGVSDTVRANGSDGWVQWEIDAIQVLNDLDGECVELRVLVSNGYKQLKAYYYARPSIPDAT
jgi:hypothetical protein